jgi:organic hydroperoxide reductase OsmC/OhrA
MDITPGPGRFLRASDGQDRQVTGGGRDFHYAIALDRSGRVTADGQAPLELEPAWKPEHLLLAGLARCTLQSLRFHADRMDADFIGTASASGRVTKRDKDGRYAFVEIDVELDLEVEPAPPGDELAALIASAERDCFVGASLDPPPRYRWRVNGTDVP